MCKEDHGTALNSFLNGTINGDVDSSVNETSISVETTLLLWSLCSHYDDGRELEVLLYLTYSQSTRMYMCTLNFVLFDYYYCNDSFC